MEMFSAALEKAGTDDPTAVGFALEGMKSRGAKGEVFMRADDHQMHFDMVISHISENVEKQVQKLTKIASKANLPGIVCSPHEVKIIKKISPELLCFTPGIRFDSEKQDQKRTMNAKEALESGSDFLIIGRPITSGDPKKNIKNILNSIK